MRCAGGHPDLARGPVRIDDVARTVRKLDRQNVARELGIDVRVFDGVERAHELDELRERERFVLFFGECQTFRRDAYWGAGAAPGTHAPPMQLLPGLQSAGPWQGQAHFPNCVLHR
jgi:hypothetical protein